MEGLVNKLAEGDIYGLAKNGVDMFRQKHEVKYTLSNDDSIPPSISNNRQGWYVVRQLTRTGNKINTGICIHIPQDYDLILVDLVGNEHIFESGNYVNILFTLKQEVVTVDNQKIGYIRLRHYPSFEMKQTNRY